MNNKNNITKIIDTRMNNFFKAVDSFIAMVNEYEKNPSDELEEKLLDLYDRALLESYNLEGLAKNYYNNYKIDEYKYDSVARLCYARQNDLDEYYEKYTEQKKKGKSRK